MSCWGSNVCVLQLSLRSQVFLFVFSDFPVCTCFRSCKRDETHRRLGKGMRWRLNTRARRVQKEPGVSSRTGSVSGADYVTALSRAGSGHGPLCPSARSFSGAPPSLICWVLIRPAPLWLYKGSNAVQMWHRSLTPFAHHGMLRIMGNDGYLDAVADISDTSFKSV